MLGEAWWAVHGDEETPGGQMRPDSILYIAF